MNILALSSLLLSLLLSVLYHACDRVKKGSQYEFWDQMEALLWSEEETVMFQCFQKNIVVTGERGVVFVGGQVTHGLLKLPDRRDDKAFVVNTDFGGTWQIYAPTKDEMDFAKRVAQAVAESVGETNGSDKPIWPAYLRVDIFDDNDGNLALMELAAGTANLWLEHAPDAATALASYFDSYLTALERECEDFYARASHPQIVPVEARPSQPSQKASNMEDVLVPPTPQTSIFSSQQ